MNEPCKSQAEKKIKQVMRRLATRAWEKYTAGHPANVNEKLRLIAATAFKAGYVQAIADDAGLLVFRELMSTSNEQTDERKDCT